MNTEDEGSGKNTGISINLPGKNLDAAASKILEATLGKTADGLGDTITTVWGGLIGDRLNEWRTRNLVSSLEKTAKILDAKGINLADCCALPNGEMYSIFEGASKQDDPDLQKLWASLLANSMNPNGTEFRNELTSTLENLEPADARFFTFIAKVERFEEDHKQRMPIVPNDMFMTDMTPEAEANRLLWQKHQEELDTFRQLEFEKIQLEETECKEACGHLLRFGLLEEHRKLRTHYWRDGDRLDEIYEGLENTAKTIKTIHTGTISGSVFNCIRIEGREPNYSLTSLGKEVASACIPIDT